MRVAKMAEKGNEKKQYGTAHVSNVDGRGMFSVFGVFKRQERASSKPVYDYASILCYVGGEIRDAFLRERLKDNEVLPLLETHSKMARGKAVIVPVPIEEAAKFLVMPCYKKAKEKGLHPADEQVKKSIEFYERVAGHCEYSEEEFLETKLGKFRHETLSSVDRRRPEFDSWWIENRELERLACPVPPAAMNFRTMEEFFAKASDCQARWVRWKRTFLEKLHTPENCDRFTGMTRHQAFWYAWKKEEKLGATLLKAKEDFEESKSGMPFKEHGPIVELVIKMTRSKFYSCGEQAKVDRQGCKSGKCSSCHTPAKAPSTRSGSWFLTCVDKEGKAEFGGEQTRKCLAMVLCAIHKYGLRDFKDAAEQCLRDSFDVFFQHGFLLLYWGNKPTIPMVDALMADVVDKCVKEFESKEFQIVSWVDACTTGFHQLLTKHCSSKMSEKDIQEMSDQFTRALGKVKTMAQTMEKERKVINSSTDPDRIRCSLMLKAVAPAIGNLFHGKWKTLSATAKKKLLTCGYRDLLDAIQRACVQCQKSSVLVPECKDKQCMCQDLSKVQDHMVDLLSRKDNPVSFIKCSLPSGDVSLSEELLGSSSELARDMVSFKDEYVYAEIMDPQTWTDYAKCSRLSFLCKVACGEIFTMLKCHLIEGYEELSKRENARLQMQLCGHCGAVEPQPGIYKMCSACKSVYYCSSTCQKKDWRAGHKGKCTNLKKT